MIPALIVTGAVMAVFLLIALVSAGVMGVCAIVDWISDGAVGRHGDFDQEETRW